MVHRPHSQASIHARDLQVNLSASMRMAGLAATAAALFYGENMFSRQPYHTSVLTGHLWVHELLHGNPRHIKDQLGMEKHVFRQLVRKLFTLTNVSNTHHVDLEEQVSVMSECTALLSQKSGFRGVSDSGFSSCAAPTYYCRSKYFLVSVHKFGT